MDLGKMREDVAEAIEKCDAELRVIGQQMVALERRRIELAGIRRELKGRQDVITELRSGSADAALGGDGA